MDVESVCLGMSGGNILMFHMATSELESVGEVEDGGVVCMGWSPEQDLVVVVTGGDKLILMTKDFDPLTETRLHQEEFGEGELEWKKFDFVMKVLSSTVKASASISTCNRTFLLA